MAEETKPTEAKEEFIKCPCCGELTLRKPLDIKSIVLDEYMSSIITGVPFSHTYTVHDTIDITVEIPEQLVKQKVFVAVQKIDRLAALEQNLDKATILKAISLTVSSYGYITTIATKNKGQIVKSYTPAAVIRAFCDKLVDLGDDVDTIIKLYNETATPENLSSLPDIMVRAVARTHDDVYNILLDTGFNSTFWKGIELA